MNPMQFLVIGAVFGVVVYEFRRAVISHVNDKRSTFRCFCNAIIWAAIGYGLGVVLT